MWKDILYLNQVERRGTWMLFILMILSVLVNVLFPLWIRPGTTFLNHHESEILDLAKVILEESYTRERRADSLKMPALPIQPFDPNHINPEHYQDYGLSKSQARTLFRYAQAGGRFWKAADLSRIQNISEADLQRLSPFLIFPEKTKKTRPKSAWDDVVNVMDLNAVDTTQLMKLPGIGKVLARRIVKYRDALGGFIAPEQLKEVYGVSSVTADRIIPYVMVDTASVKQLNLLTDSFKVLLRHPYLDYDRVKRIVKARRITPALISRDSIEEFLQVPPEEQGKISPYVR